jgi:hypothetical protein
MEAIWYLTNAEGEFGIHIGLRHQARQLEASDDASPSVLGRRGVRKLLRDGGSSLLQGLWLGLARLALLVGFFVMLVGIPSPPGTLACTGCAKTVRSAWTPAGQHHLFREPPPLAGANQTPIQHHHKPSRSAEQRSTRFSRPRVSPRSADAGDYEGLDAARQNDAGYGKCEVSAILFGCRLHQLADLARVGQRNSKQSNKVGVSEIVWLTSNAPRCHCVSPSCFLWRERLHLLPVEVHLRLPRVFSAASGRGIGSMIARGLVENGANVYVRASSRSG